MVLSYGENIFRLKMMAAAVSRLPKPNGIRGFRHSISCAHSRDSSFPGISYFRRQVCRKIPELRILEELTRQEKPIFVDTNISVETLTGEI